MSDAYEVVMVPCCECGASVDTREVEDGGGPDGCQLTDGRWVCRAECWEAAVAKRKAVLDDLARLGQEFDAS